MHLQEIKLTHVFARHFHLLEVFCALEVRIYILVTAAYGSVCAHIFVCIFVVKLLSPDGTDS